MQITTKVERLLRLAIDKPGELVQTDGANLHIGLTTYALISKWLHNGSIYKQIMLMARVHLAIMMQCLCNMYNDMG